MITRSVAPVALLLVILQPSIVSGQNVLMERIRNVQDVAVWQKEIRTRGQVQRLLQNLDSSDNQTRQSAYEALARARPVPAFADAVIHASDTAAKRTRDKFAVAMAFEIRRDWEEAKKAAQTLAVAKTSGGFAAIERAIVHGNAAQAGGPLIAAAYSGDRRSARLVARYWDKNSIAGKRALLILGPAAAPELVAQLESSDRRLRSEVTVLLGKIGTSQQIPPLEAIRPEADRNLQRRIDQAIERIRSRE